MVRQYGVLPKLLKKKKRLRLVNSVKVSPWGLGYRIVTKKFDIHPAGVEAARQELEIVGGLFPSPRPPDWSDYHMWTDPGLPSSEPPSPMSSW